jgi:Ca-activated chloride channel homolog
MFAAASFHYKKKRIMEYGIGNIGLRALGLMVLIVASATAPAQQDKLHIKSGNESFKGTDYEQAIKFYDEALKRNPNNTIAQFNKADALYKAGRHAEAGDLFGKLAASPSVSDQKRAQALHNLGNTYLQQQKFNEGVDAYRQSLRLNPKDEDTRYNLAYANKLLQKQQQQDQSCDKPGDGDKGDKDKDKENKGNEGDKDQQDKGDKDKDKPDNQDQPGDSKPQDQKPEPKPMTPEEAEMLLNALEKSEKDVQKKVNKALVPGKKTPAEKDW